MNSLENDSVNKTLLTFFDDSVKKYPNKPALCYEGHSLSYKELDEKSNQLASLLPASPGELIALCLDRSLEMLISMLAILKVGAAYLPIDPLYPSEHIQYILEDSQASFLITLEKYHQSIPAFSMFDQENLFVLDNEEISKKLEVQSVTPIESLLTEDNIAYVIYTSGSTGKPKGVPITHHSIASLLSASKKCFIFNEEDTWIMLHSFSFDFSVWEIWGALSTGGKLLISSYETSRDPVLLYDLLKKEKISILNQTPSVFFLLMEMDLDEPEKLSYLRYVFIGAEMLHIQKLEPWWKKYGDLHPKIVNLYGPTETTIFASYRILEKEDVEKRYFGNVGHALNGVKLYVVDNNQTLCSVNKAGEICIAGFGLSPGYLNHPELAHKNFILNSFAHEINGSVQERLYKTGDLGCFLPDGSLRYLGRMDSQVKLRGYRISLEEIEQVINSYSAIAQSHVIVQRKDGYECLTAYYILKGSVIFSKEALQAFLSSKLPAYKIPSALIELESFPFTLNGKISKAKLLDSNQSLPVAPRCKPFQSYSELEMKIISLWSSMLNVPQEMISTKDNFFQLGGDSLSIAEMLIKIRKQFKKEIVLENFIVTPTIELLVNLINDEFYSCSSFDELKKQLELDLKLDESINPLAIMHENPVELQGGLVTGATGFLGVYLVGELIKNTQSMIYCLVRASSKMEAKSMLNRKFEKSQLMHLVNHPRIKVLLGDLEKKELGLSKEDAEFVYENIDSVYHVGAWVHHVFDYKKLYPSNVGSTIELLKMASKKKNKSIHFISTISTVNEQNPLEMNGYVLTKWVSEKLLKQARKRGMSVFIYRPGNITGDTQTAYCAPDFNKILLKLKTCLQLKKFYSEEREALDMMPVDLLAKEIVALSSHPSSDKYIYNLHNPTTLTWKTYLDHVKTLGYELEEIKDKAEWDALLNESQQCHYLFSLIDSYSMETQSDFNQPIPDYQDLIERQVQFLTGVDFLSLS